MKENVLKLYLSIAIQLVQQYTQEASQKFTPLHLYLKSYFKQYSKYGKRDRNAISELVYAYFRAGHTFPKTKIEERIVLGSYLCANTKESIHYFLAQLQLNSYEPEVNVSKRVEQAKKMFSGFDPASFLPFEIELSTSLSKEDYFHSFLQKASTFIRIAENRHKVLQDLEKNGIEFEPVETNELALKILSTKNLSDLETWKKGYFEVQDLSSQETARFLHPKKGDQWWDVCAASGGKSLLLLSKEKNIYILASDVRKNILENYKERIKRNNFLNFETQVLDASQSFELDKQFDGIICDAPCSGSGTWHRSPENLYFFTQENLLHYSTLQKKILENTLKYIKPGKNLIYITCSAFKEENENVLEAIAPNPKSARLINNSDQGADCMFVSEISR
ncbi:MAG: tRNA/rRNA cytosine-C5-methylase [Bacteroidetes bacterium]|jgi:16S rRNA (cytosine967-C5)-methyltransferase|nr:tRNA/rRNA cytosine-C5-methylase [Bacteroidota bacterium]